MKALIIFLSLILSSNSFSECSIDTQIKDLKKKLAEYQKEKDHAWDRYGANCFYIGVNSCWVCSTEVRMINSDNTMPVSEDLCSKIKCVMVDPTGITGLVSACLGIGIPILGLLGESCSDWCTKWHAQDNLVTQTQSSIFQLQETRKSVCADNTTACDTDPSPLKCKCLEAGKTWSTNTNLCCEDSSNVTQCLCEADMKHKWNYTTNNCEPLGSGPTTTTTTSRTTSGSYTASTTSTTAGTSTTDDVTDASTNSSNSPTGTGLAVVSDRAPLIASKTNKNATNNWYDDVADMYNSGSASSGNLKSGTTANNGSIVVGEVSKTGDKQKTADINTNSTDIFKLVTSMYQRRYYAGLIGENIKAVTTKTSIKTGKKPVIYK